jgi:hypothetical protein
LPREGASETPSPDGGVWEACWRGGSPCAAGVLSSLPVIGLTKLLINEIFYLAA